MRIRPWPARGAANESCRNLRAIVPRLAVGPHATIDRMRPGALIFAVVLAGAVVAVAGCGSPGSYDVDKTRACLVKQPGVAVSNKVDFIASNALGGAISARLLGNEVTLSFTSDRQEAERIVRAYQRFKGKNIGLEDVLHATHNVVALWAMHPSDTALQTIRDCLN